MQLCDVGGNNNIFYMFVYPKKTFYLLSFKKDSSKLKSSFQTLNFYCVTFASSQNCLDFLSKN